MRKGEYPTKVAAFAEEATNTGYALGIADQVNDILNIHGQRQRMSCDHASSSVNIRGGLSFNITHYTGRQTMFVNLQVDCTEDDILETIYDMRSNGYEVFSFDWNTNTNRPNTVRVIMNIEDAYDPDIFRVIENSRMFKRQIVNEMEAMQK